MMPRWHHSDSSSERYQEVKSIKTFYAAHISRSQAKSMFGNWTICAIKIQTDALINTPVRKKNMSAYRMSHLFRSNYFNVNKKKDLFRTNLDRSNLDRTWFEPV